MVVVGVVVGVAGGGAVVVGVAVGVGVGGVVGVVVGIGGAVGGGVCVDGAVAVGIDGGVAVAVGIDGAVAVAVTAKLKVKMKTYKYKTELARLQKRKSVTVGTRNQKLAVLRLAKLNGLRVVSRAVENGFKIWRVEA